MSKKINQYEKILLNYKKIKVNEEYDYGRFCEELELKNTGGDTRAKQMTILKSIYNMKEIKRGKYIIEWYKDITKEEALKLVEDKRGKNPNSRGNNKGIYGEDIMNSLLIYCMNNGERVKDDNEVIIRVRTNKDELMRNIGMKNSKNYDVAMNTPNYFCEELGIKYRIFDYMFSELENYMNNALKSVIDMITRRKLGLCNTYVLVSNKKIQNLEELREASDEEVEEINKIKAAIASEMGYNNYSVIYYKQDKKEIKRFHYQLQQKLEKELGIKYCYYETEIRLVEKNVKEYLKKNNIKETQECIKYGNKKYLDCINKKVINKMQLIYDEQMQKKKLEKGETIYYNTAQLEEEFIIQSEKILESLINVDSKEIYYRECDIENKDSDIARRFLKIRKADDYILEEKYTFNYYEDLDQDDTIIDIL